MVVLDPRTGRLVSISLSVPPEDRTGPTAPRPARPPGERPHRPEPAGPPRSHLRTTRDGS